MTRSLVSSEREPRTCSTLNLSPQSEEIRDWRRSAFSGSVFRVTRAHVRAAACFSHRCSSLQDKDTDEEESEEEGEEEKDGSSDDDEEEGSGSGDEDELEVDTKAPVVAEFPTEALTGGPETGNCSVTHTHTHTRARAHTLSLHRNTSQTETPRS
jgi:hypothetical protein